jgi:hypoxanthine phosphoribosyltransferase
MSFTKIHDLHFKPFLTQEQIAVEVKRVAEHINHDYKDKNVVFIAILNGAFMFASDIFKQFNMPCEMEFVKLASYEGTQSTGSITELIGLERDFTGKHIIILEDIIDTGKTLHHFIQTIEKNGAASIKICALLQKPDALQYPITTDYLCFNIPNRFVVGYGLDYNGLGRNIPEILQLAD